MSNEISQTSMFMSRIATLKKSQASGVAADKNATINSGAAQSAASTTPLAQSDKIVVTSLNEKVQDLQKLLDSVAKNISALSTSRDRASEAVGILEEAGGLTVRARETLKTNAGYEGNKDRLSALETAFTGALEKLAQLVDSSNVAGVNLLKGETLTTSFDAEGKNIFETSGLDISPEVLEFRKPDFSSLEKVQDSRIDVMNAIDVATTLRHVLSSDLMLMQTRQEFSQNTISTLSEGANIPVADLGDEAANLLALQIRQQLSASDASLASESQQHILKQF